MFSLARWLLIAFLAVIGAYIVLSPETASAGAADFGDWFVASVTSALDAVTGAIGSIL